MMKARQVVLFAGAVLMTLSVYAQEVSNAVHTIVAIEQDRFHGWPANNGVWQWGDEILVGYTQGDYAVEDGHNITGMQETLLSRSVDGGETWTMYDPEDFLDDGNITWVPKNKKTLEQPINFHHKGFAMRITGTGYHGNDDPEGGFYYSYDRGKTWRGPYFLGRINEHPELKGKAIVARTDYIVLDKMTLYIFAAVVENGYPRLALFTTDDGGMQFEFANWISPANVDYNAHMCSTVQLAENKFIMAFRKVYPALDNKKGNMIHALVSEDGGRSWQSLSTVKHFDSSSNPPALLRMKDGRLVCVYGDRHNSVMAGKYSHDEGKTWSEEFIIRDDFKDLNSTWDFGYPRLVQRRDGKLVAMYYWASPEHRQQYIAATIWDVPVTD